MYRPAKTNGDTVAVPQLLFARLGFPDAGEARFRVALYLLSHGECDAAGVAGALRLPQAEVEKALEYWEGAGLLERCGQPGGEALPAPKPSRRRHMNTAQMNEAAGADPVLGAMMQELQRIFGGLVSHRDQTVFCTLYSEDGFAADLILTAAIHCRTEGKTGALKVERTLFDWRRDGIDDCAAADAHLKRMEARRARYGQVAALLGIDEKGMTTAERKGIDRWGEEYGYGNDMLELARLYAGEKDRDVKYLSSIMKRWYAAGYRTTKDVQRAEEGRNLRVQGAKKAAPGKDLLDSWDYTPMSRTGHKKEEA